MYVVCTKCASRMKAHVFDYRVKEERTDAIHIGTLYVCPECGAEVFVSRHVVWDDRLTVDMEVDE